MKNEAMEILNSIVTELEKKHLNMQQTQVHTHKVFWKTLLIPLIW